MKIIRNLAVTLLAMLSFITFNAFAAIDPAAPIVRLNITCSNGAGGTLDNCFTSSNSLTAWLNATRKPNVSTPLRVDIGPGTFTGTLKLTCSPASGYTGYISFVGSGRQQTTIEGNEYLAPISVSACTELNFSAFTVNGPLYGGVQWNGGGRSNWIDMTINGLARAWYEEGCSSTPGAHYWFSSQLKATAGFSIAETYRASCDVSWFFGSELTVSVPANAYPANGGSVTAYGVGEIHVYGSVLRALVDGDTQGNLSAAFARGGKIHIHGTGIDVISNTGKNITALSVDTNGEIHANQSSFFLSSGSGAKVTRINNMGGHIHAPYLWEHIPNPSTVPNFVSANGADMSVVTTGTSDGQPHTVIYSTTCASISPAAAWWDAVDKVCR